MEGNGAAAPTEGCAAATGGGGFVPGGGCCFGAPKDGAAALEWEELGMFSPLESISLRLQLKLACLE